MLSTYNLKFAWRCSTDHFTGIAIHEMVLLGANRLGISSDFQANSGTDYPVRIAPSSRHTPRQLFQVQVSGRNVFFASQPYHPKLLDTKGVHSEDKVEEVKAFLIAVDQLHFDFDFADFFPRRQSNKNRL